MIKKITLGIVAFCLVILSLNIAYADDIAVSILPLKAFVDKITGNILSVAVAVPQGASPESYEPTPLEVEQITKAKVYFSLDMPSEQFKILPFLSKDTKLVELDKIISSNFKDLDIDGERDPHIWLSVPRAIGMVEAMKEALCEVFPEQKNVFEQNAELYVDELSVLNQDLKTQFSNIKMNKFISFHPAFQYFADDYGLIMYALEEHGKEATAKQLDNILKIAKVEGIKTIFIQDEISSRQALAFAEAMNGKVVELSPLAYDYVDNMRKMANTLLEEQK